MSTLSQTLRPALAALLFSGLAASAPAQTLDVRPGRLELVQTLQNPNLPLFAGRTTFARASVSLTDPESLPVMIDGILRVYADGQEIPGSPFYSDNGPFPAGQFSNPLEEHATLNFVFIAPESSDVVCRVELNPPGPNFVPEVNTANNFIETPSLSIQAIGEPVFAYAPIDLRPNGETTPNLPDPDLIKPGVGDNFIQAIYPGGLIEYRRIDAESKLWTQSVSSTGSALNGSLANDLALMSPQPDFIYGWVPGAIPYNGQAQLPGVASMGNTQPIRHQRTYAHEVGHNTSLFHNSTQAGWVGVDVEHHLNLTESLPMMKASNLNDIMVPGLLTPQAWVSTGSYQNFINHPAWDVDADTDAAPGAGGDGPRLLVSGLWNRETGEISLDPVVEVPGGRLTPPGAPGARDLVVRASVRGETARELPLTVRTSLDECPACRPAPVAEDDDAASADSAGWVHPLVSFTAVLPARAPSGEALDRLELFGTGTHPAQALSVTRSAAAPQVRLTAAPSAGAPTGAVVQLAWEGVDPDGDALHYVLRYSPDGDDHFVPLLDRTTATSHTVRLAELPHFVPGAGFFELLATDGLNTTRVRTEPLQGPGAYAGAAGGSPPSVEIYHPDDGFTFLKGSNVVLHSSGWDREDHSLRGASIQWSSDVDGALGSGRRFTVSDLSVGTHVITVTATDSGGLMTSRSNTIEILDRGLPELPGEFCASDIGFGGPGDSVLSLCGGDLGAGGVAELLLSGAPADTPAFLALSLDANPTPVKGGTLVPFPWAVLFVRMTDGNGEVSNPNVTATSLPTTSYLQYVIVDGSQPAGFGFSNALFVEF